MTVILGSATELWILTLIWNSVAERPAVAWDLSVPFSCHLLPLSEDFYFIWHSLGDHFFLSKLLTFFFVSLNVF